MIGDRAMNIDTSAYVANWDLGEEWTRETGLPFVFAMWVAASPHVSTEVSQALTRARDAGLAHIDSIVAAEAPRYGLTAADCRAYFLNQLHFILGPGELAGLDLFRQWAIELQLLPATSQQLVLAPL